MDEISIVVPFGGVDRRLTFNQLALEIFVKHLDNDAMNSSAIYAMFYGGLRGAAYAEQQQMELSFGEVVAICDTTGQEVKAKVDAFFASTQKYKEWLSKSNELIRSLVTAKTDGESSKKKQRKAKKLTGS